jgi:hypothetical protein
MVRWNLLLTISAASCFVGTVLGQVELKGTVKDGSGTAITGAVVSLKKKSFKDTTDTKGEFIITETTSVLANRNSSQSEMKFVINGKQVFFTIPQDKKSISLKIISANGQNVYESSFETTTEKIPAIPQLNSGIYLIKLSSSNRQIIKKIITTGDQLVLSNISETGMKNGPSMNLRLASAVNVDTLLAIKSGYVAKQIGINTYVKSGMEIVLEKEAPPGECKLPELPASSALTKVNEKLPDPFTFYDGTKLTKKSQWECRRKEILAMASKYIYGPCPPKPDEVTGTVSGGTINIDCKVGTKNASFTATISGSGDPICYKLSGGIYPASAKELKLGSGYESKIKTLYGISEITPNLAIAWMIDRVMDVLELNPTSGHDPKKMMVSGCSGCGKGAFLVGAYSRVPLTVIVESGGGGVASWRMTEWYRHGAGKSSYKCGDLPQGIDNLEETGICGPWVAGVASWVRSSPAKVKNLPFDQHMLLACIAPRYLCHVTNQHGQNEWCHLGGTCEALSAWAAEPVWNALGVPENMGFLMYTESSAPGHCSNPSSATTLANAFFDRVFKGNTSAKTDVMTMNASDLQQPQSAWKEMWIDWDMNTKLE